MGKSREPMLRSRDERDDPVNGMEPQRPERFAERLKRVVHQAVGRMRALLAEGGAEAVLLRSPGGQREQLFACLGADPAKIRLQPGTARGHAWSARCCTDPARRGQFAECYVTLSRAEWRLSPNRPAVAVLVGQCRRCGTLHWMEATQTRDGDE